MYIEMISVKKKQFTDQLFFGQTKSTLILVPLISLMNDGHVVYPLNSEKTISFILNFEMLTFFWIFLWIFFLDIIGL